MTQLKSTVALLCMTMLTGCQSKQTTNREEAVLFDDFSYASLDAFAANGWKARTAKGWPGVAGAEWEGALEFIDDGAQPGNRLARMTAITNGQTAQQAQFCHQRKY